MMHCCWSQRAAGITGMHTKHFTNSLMLKSKGVRSGEFRGHGINPACPVNLARTAVL